MRLKLPIQDSSRISGGELINGISFADQMQGWIDRWIDLESFWMPLCSSSSSASYQQQAYDAM